MRDQVTTTFWLFRFAWGLSQKVKKHSLGITPAVAGQGQRSLAPADMSCEWVHERLFVILPFPKERKCVAVGPIMRPALRLWPMPYAARTASSEKLQCSYLGEVRRVRYASQHSCKLQAIARTIAFRAHFYRTLS